MRFEPQDKYRSWNFKQKIWILSPLSSGYCYALIRRLLLPALSLLFLIWRTKRHTFASSA